MFEKLIKEMASLEEVSAIMLGGSRGVGTQDKHSDYDVYVYTKSELHEGKRKNIIQKYVKYMEYSNSFWELEDDGILLNGIDIEFIYRDINTIEENLKSTIDGNVGNGYSTCFVNNFFESKVLYEEDKIITEIRERLSQNDFSKMFESVVIKNAMLLSDYMPSLHYQIEKAVKRNDRLSVNHRIAAYMDILFDILFAINSKTHPGEKRLLEYALKLELLPNNFRLDINQIIDNQNRNNVIMLEHLSSLTDAVYQLLKELGYNVTSNTYKNAQ